MNPSIGKPTGTVTFLFTDIEGSTKRWEAHPQQMHSAFARQEAILRQAIEVNSGYAYKMIGDAFQAAFHTAPQALQAALDAQQALHSETWLAETGEVRVRMALHTGVTEEREDDYLGPALNRVARLLSAGHGGQVLLTLATQQLLRDNLPPGVTLRDMGSSASKTSPNPSASSSCRPSACLRSSRPSRRSTAAPTTSPARRPLLLAGNMRLGL